MFVGPIISDINDVKPFQHYSSLKHKHLFISIDVGVAHIDTVLSAGRQSESTSVIASVFYSKV